MPSAFSLYLKDNYAAIKASLRKPCGKDASLGDVAREIKKRWRAIPPADKAAYLARAHTKC